MCEKMFTGFHIPIAIPESHNRVIHCLSKRTITNQQRKQNETLRDSVRAAPVLVMLYSGLFHRATGSFR